MHEATAYPGGRCRSYFDRTIGMTIDNGNHLVLSGNHAVVGFAGSDRQRRAAWSDRDTAEFPFVDLASNERWRLRISDGLPWWIFDESRRVPGTRLGEYLRLWRLLRVKADVPVAEVIDCSGPLYHRLVHPLLLAALNIEPREGSAALASAVVRETLAAGGKACRPLIAREGLGPTFIEPAIEHLRQRNVEVRLDHELRALRFDGGRIAALDFGAETTTLGAGDAVILAVPSHAAARACPRAVGAARSSRDRQRSFPHRRAARHAADDGHHQRHDRMGLRVRGAPVGHDQQCRPPDGGAARDARSDDMAGGFAGCGNCRRTAAVADRARAAGDLRGDAGGKRQAPARANGMGQSHYGRGLDRDRVARDIGERGAVRQSRGGGRDC